MVGSVGGTNNLINMISLNYQQGKITGMAGAWSLLRPQQTIKSSATLDYLD